MQNLILIGGGGHCKSCIDVIEQAGTFQIAGMELIYSNAKEYYLEKIEPILGKAGKAIDSKD